jgi:3-phosphoglycerate kinase
VIVGAHLGRPAGKPDPKYSLAPVAARLGELLGRPVTLAADVIGPSARAAVSALQPGGLVMLENLTSSEAFTVVGGGASLEFIRGKTLPGLVALETP